MLYKENGKIYFKYTLTMAESKNRQLESLLL